MTFDQDLKIQRRGSGSLKWQSHPDDVLPMWVADMDFRSPEPVIRALHDRAEHGVFGYASQPVELAQVICDRMQCLYRWKVTPEQILFLPGVVSAINVACRAFGSPGDGVLVQTPVYPPFLTAPVNNCLELQTADLSLLRSGRTIKYEIDYDAFEGAITPRTRLFILCHPHNPTGAEYSTSELAQMAAICLRHDILIISDEIHCELLLGSTRHNPMAALSPEIADRCISLMAPSKTFNLPGLGCSFAIVPNAVLRQRMSKASEGLVPLMNVFGLAAALAAYREGEEWRAALLRYLTVNRDLLVEHITSHLQQLRTTVPQATYLAWIDCREAGIGLNPYEFFLNNAKVALSDGATFGQAGAGFVRLNFGCPRPRLVDALERMTAALRACH